MSLQYLNCHNRLLRSDTGKAEEPLGHVHCVVAGRPEVLGAPRILSLDQATGAATPLVPLSYVGFPVLGDPRVNAMEADPDTGVIVGEFGKILKTVDGGQSWVDKSSDRGITLLAVAFSDDLNGFAVGLDGLLLKTEDTGESWTVCETGIQQHLFGILWDGKQWLSVGADGFIGYGDPTCESWEFKKLSEMDWGWHTAAAKLSKGYLIVGATQGIWHNGNWSYLGS